MFSVPAQGLGMGPLKEAWSKQMKGSALPALNYSSIYSFIFRKDENFS